MTNPTRDPLQRVADLRPNDARLEELFPGARRDDILRHLISAADDEPHVVRFAPHRDRRRVLAPVAASVAVAAAAVGAVVLTSATSNDSGTKAGGPARVDNNPTIHVGGLSSTSPVGDHQYAYRAASAFPVDASGHRKGPAKNTERNRDWVSPAGKDVSLRSGGGPSECYVFAGPRQANFEEPTRSFFASLPTSTDSLERYLRSHVSGSSSRDEAVFVAVGDMLRTDDLLASPKLRATLVAVLARTGGVTVHRGVRDQLGRPAVRADFMDQKRRPGELNSLYFSPTTYQLLEERDGSNGQSDTVTGPSAKYSGPVEGGSPTPVMLTGPASVDVMTAERVVDRLPTIPPHCQKG